MLSSQENLVFLGSYPWTAAVSWSLGSGLHDMWVPPNSQPLVQLPQPVAQSTDPQLLGLEKVHGKSMEGFLDILSDLGTEHYSSGFNKCFTVTCLDDTVLYGLPVLWVWLPVLWVRGEKKKKKETKNLKVDKISLSCDQISDRRPWFTLYLFHVPRTKEWRHTWYYKGLHGRAESHCL